MLEKKPFPSCYRVACHTDHIGPGSTFVAIKGMKFDGTHFIHGALARGATKIVIEKGMELTSEVKAAIAAHNAELAIVPSTRLALAECSAEAYDYPSRSLKLIAITGTKGKTTTAFLVEHILKTAGFKTALLSTVENRILDVSYTTDLTTPQPDYLHPFFDACRKQGVQYVIMETAAQAFSLHRLATLTFDAAAFTNFSLEHSEFYPTQDDYFNAKAQLFNQLSPQARVVLNVDDTRVAECAKNAALTTCISVEHDEQGGASYMGEYINCKNSDRDDTSATSLSSPISVEGHMTATAKVIQSDLTTLTLEITSGKYRYICSSKALLGKFNAYNVLTAISLVEQYGISPGVIQAAISSFGGVPGRLSRYDLPNKAVAFIDNAHTPSSFEAILLALRPLSSDLIVVFGAGGDRDAVKRPLMGAIAGRHANTVILTNDNPQSEDPMAIIEQIKAGIETSDLAKIHVILDREKAIKKAYELSTSGSIIALLGKGPVEYQEVKDVKVPFSEAGILRALS